MHDQIEDRKRARMSERHMSESGAEASVAREEDLQPPEGKFLAGGFVLAMLVGIAVAIWLFAG